MITTVLPRWSGDATPPFVLNQAKELVKKGWSVTVLAPHSKGAAKEEMIEGVCVQRFRYLLPERLQSLCYGGGILVQLKRTPLKFWQLPFLCLSELFAVWRLNRRRSFDVVHAHSIIPQGLVAWLSFACPGNPVLVSSHGADIFSLSSGGVYGWLKRKVLVSADRVTTNSSVGKEVLLELGVSEDKLDILPSTPTLAVPDSSFVQKIEREYKSKGAVVILFVGRLIEQKGVADLIDAVASLPQECRVHLLIAGDGDERTNLEVQVEKYKLQDKVEFLGWLKPDLLTAYYKIADIFVGPSKPGAKGEVESQGLVFVEAMASGAAMIGTRCGGIVDMVLDRETGLLVEPGDVNALSAAIRELIKSPELRISFSARAREVYESRFSPEVTALQLSAIYDDLVGAVNNAASKLLRE